MMVGLQAKVTLRCFFLLGVVLAADCGVEVVVAAVDEGVGAVAGRPLRGGMATGTSGGEWQGFRRAVDTVSVLLPICSLKNLKERSNTRYGPS